MSDLPACLQPALEQIRKFETEITVMESEAKRLNENIFTLNSEKDELNKSLEEEKKAHLLAVETYEKEKLALRELNLVIRDQLHEKSEELNGTSTTLFELEAENGRVKELNSELSEQMMQVDSERARLNVEQETSSQENNTLTEELQKSNSSLKEENAALVLENSALKQRQLQNDEDSIEKRLLLAELEQLKKELDTYKTENADTSFLQSENRRLVQRHGEITQEKMQASANMHRVQNELKEVEEKLNTTLKSLDQLEFEHQGLQNLHKTLQQERTSLLADNGTLVNEKAKLQEENENLNELIQRVTTEKERIMQELKQEHLKADAMTEEVNQLRIKSKTAVEDTSGHKGGRADEYEANTDSDIEIVSQSTGDSSHYPGKFYRDEENI